MTDRAKRIGDMDPTTTLVVTQEMDGDMVLGIMGQDDKDRYFNHSIEFCTSGGRSPNTRAALVRLLEAMEEDNKQ